MKKIILKNKQPKILAVFIFLLAFTSVISYKQAPVSGIASGCSSSRPTAITGTVKGFGGTYNNWGTNILVGIDLLNSAGQKVDINGNVTTAGYSYVDKANTTTAQPGAASGLDQTVGANNSTGPLCVSTKIKTAWFELYPKNGSGATDTSYYGESNDQRMDVKANVTNTYGIRIPTAHAYGGNTGDVNGYVSYQGQSIAPSNLQFRVFPVSIGAACGVQGFSAGASTIGTGATNTYYKINNIAGGQCGAKSQQYKLFATCKNVCGTSSKTIMKYVYVSNGAKPRVDFSF